MALVMQPREKTVSLAMRSYVLGWLASLVSWIAVLVNYVMRYSFLGCEGRTGVALGLCRVLSPNMDSVLLVSILLLPLLTTVLLTRAVMYRGLQKWETLLATGSWLTFLSSATFFPSS